MLDLRGRRCPGFLPRLPRRAGGLFAGLTRIVARRRGPRGDAVAGLARGLLPDDDGLAVARRGRALRSGLLPGVRRRVDIAWSGRGGVPGLSAFLVPLAFLGDGPAKLLLQLVDMLDGCARGRRPSKGQTGRLRLRFDRFHARPNFRVGRAVLVLLMRRDVLVGRRVLVRRVAAFGVRVGVLETAPALRPPEAAAVPAGDGDPARALRRLRLADVEVVDALRRARFRDHPDAANEQLPNDRGAKTLGAEIFRNRETGRMLGNERAKRGRCGLALLGFETEVRACLVRGDVPATGLRGRGRTRAERRL